MTIPVYFSLGSNEGDRKAYIEKALELMREAFGTPYSKLSDIIETPSWGFDSDPFLNCAVLFNLKNPNPYKILEQCKTIEKDLGREENVQYDKDGKRIYHSRPIDIDILFVGDQAINTPTLTIPHPLISKRDFVKIPLRQIASESYILQLL